MPQSRVALLLALSLTIACGATILSVPGDAGGPQPDAGDAGPGGPQPDAGDAADPPNDCVRHGFECVSSCSGDYTLMDFSCDTASLSPPSGPYCCRTF